jgi:hypothetical protein
MRLVLPRDEYVMKAYRNAPPGRSTDSLHRSVFVLLSRTRLMQVRVISGI